MSTEDKEHKRKSSDLHLVFGAFLLASVFHTLICPAELWSFFPRSSRAEAPVWPFNADEEIGGVYK